MDGSAIHAAAGITSLGGQCFIAKPPYYPPLKGFIENYCTLEGDQNCPHTECGGEMSQSICFLNFKGLGYLILMNAFSIIYCLTTRSTKTQCWKCISNTIMSVIICRLCNPDSLNTRAKKHLNRSPICQSTKLETEEDGSGGQEKKERRETKYEGKVRAKGANETTKDR